MAEAAQKVGNVKNDEANFGAVLNSSSWLVPAALNCNPELLSPPDAAICPPLADCSLTCRQQVGAERRIQAFTEVLAMGTEFKEASLAQVCKFEILYAASLTSLP